MFESWYADIGKKIKNWAIWCFIIEALGAIITGLAFIIIEGIEYAWWALLVLIFGPIVAFVGSWLLYGFGELIEKTDKNESNTAAILNILNNSHKSNSNAQQTNKAEYTTQHTQKNSENATHANMAPKASYHPQKESPTDGTIFCPSCGFEQSQDRIVCFKCGKSLVPFYCGNCKHLGPYDGNCPSCNSTIKIFVYDRNE